MAGNTVKETTTNFGKLDKFEGHDFRRWQKKMHFLLRTLKVVFVLTTPIPKLVEDATVEAIRIRAKWENDDYMCRGHILNGMSDSLFDVYTNVESAKELWYSLESKYMAEDSSSKKFLKDFKHTLKHDKDELSLVQLDSHLRIEESLRTQDSDKGKGKEKCGKTGHFKKDCRSGNKNNANAGGSGKGSKDQSQDQGQNLVHVWNSFVKYFVLLISEAFYVHVDAIAWWIDSGATTHVCKDRLEDGSVLYMGDEHFAPVHGKESVALEFSFGKTITLFNVLYVLKLSRDAIFDDNRFFSIPRPKDIIPNVQESQMDYHTDGVLNEIPEPQKEKAIDDEIGSIMENNTWVLSDLPPGCKPLGCKWIFKRKMKVDGTIDKFKARL
nr:hypothetical protein [Tanacetum cinerariifolium]